MSNHTSSKQSTFRRTIAGIAAAGAIAFGGLGTISATDASAAGVRQQTYVVQSSAVQVQSNVTGSNPKRSL